MENVNATKSPSSLTNSAWMWAAAGAVIITVTQTGFILHLYRKCSALRSQLQQVSNECVVLGQEIRELRDTIREVKSTSTGAKAPPKRISGAIKVVKREGQRLPVVSKPDDIERGVQFFEPVDTPPPQLGSSSESSEYIDAADDWTTPPSSSSSESPSPSNGYSTAAAVKSSSVQEKLDRIDLLHGSGETSVEYAELKRLQTESSVADGGEVEVLWRLARACRLMSSSLDPKDHRRKDLLLEGQEYATKAYNLDDANFNVVKWIAILTGASTDYVGMKERIQQGYLFKQYLDKGLEMDPNEYSLLHMRGRFAFSVASLSWIERKAAATFFATPPSATFEEAIADFLKVEEIRSNWVENLLYLAKSYLAVKDKESAVKHLRAAVQATPADSADKEAQEEAKLFLQKHSK